MMRMKATSLSAFLLTSLKVSAKAIGRIKAKNIIANVACATIPASHRGYLASMLALDSDPCLLYRFITIEADAKKVLLHSIDEQPALALGEELSTVEAER